LKHNVLGFQQAKLIENGLNVEDAFVLRVIKDMYSSATMEFKDFDGIKYMWINYSYLLDQIPIVGSKRNLMRKIELYGKEYLLLRTLEKSRKGKKGNFSYISPTPKLDALQDYDLMTESHKGYDKIAQPLGQNRISLMTESHKKDTSIKDPSVKDTTLDDFFESIWKLYPRMEGKGSVKKTQKEKLFKIGIDEMTRAVNRYIKAKAGEDKKYLQMGSTFFNSGYVDYLDENYQQSKPVEHKPVQIMYKDRE